MTRRCQDPASADKLTRGRPGGRDKEATLGANRPVAVVSAVPALRRGLTAMLDGTAFSPVEPDDLGSWVDGAENRVVLVAVSSPHDVHLVVDLRQARDDVVVVALVHELSPRTVREALVAGASSVASWDASPEEVVSLLEAGLASRSILPTGIMQILARRILLDDEPIELGREEMEWLRALARGETVSELANRIAYSEREMYRLLRGVYDSLGVSTRVEALVWAVQHGIVE